MINVKKYLLRDVKHNCRRSLEKRFQDNVFISAEDGIWKELKRSHREIIGEMLFFAIGTADRKNY